MPGLVDPATGLPFSQKNEAERMLELVKLAVGAILPEKPTVDEVFVVSLNILQSAMLNGCKTFQDGQEFVTQKLEPALAQMVQSCLTQLAAQSAEFSSPSIQPPFRVKPEDSARGTSLSSAIAAENSGRESLSRGS